VKLTSGSTGTPRGIAVSAAALLADEAQLFASMGLAGHRRYLAALPLSHSYGLSSLALPALGRDVTLIVPEDRSPLAPLAAAVAGEATFLPTVPAFLGAVTRLAEPPPCPPSVRLVISAGAVLPADVAARFRALFGLPVHVFYGASECGGICYDREGGAAERGSVGTPVQGVALALDEEDGRIEVRSPAVALGYFPVAAPELAGGRFRAGDLGFLRPDGELELRGRADDVLKIKGKNVNPREIEAVLAQLPGVTEVAVLGLPGSAASGPVLRAVLAADGATLSHERVREWCRAHLAEHKVPRSVLFVPELPRNARGKLDRAALSALVAGG
jgi:long-chain acyl-CoA synthetase